MDDWIVPVLLIVGVPIALAVWLVARALKAKSQIEELANRLEGLEWEMTLMKREHPAAAPVAEAAAAAKASALMAAQAKLKTPVAVPSTAARTEEAPEPPPIVMPKPAVSVQPTMQPPPIPAPVFTAVVDPAASAVVAPAAKPAFNWEQFMGVKGFAWLGGFALFLCVVFFVKYAFDHNLIPPELRVAIGFLTGLVLMVGGVWLVRKEYAVLGQTLCGTGTVTLYAVTFACRSIYQFEFFGVIPTFLLMVLITTTAFLLAVRLEAMVVAILGMLGGFLTPILLSTGQDNPFGLFGYIAILDIGLILVALHRRWFFLVALAALGTVLLQTGWAAEFFVAEKYMEGNKILIALGVLLGFNLIYLAAAGWAKRRQQTNWWLSGSQLGLAFVALAFSASFLSFAPLAHRPVLMFSFVFLIDLGVGVLVLIDTQTVAGQALAGLAAFGLLAGWTVGWMNNELLNAGLALYLVFAVFHSAYPLVLRRRGIAAPLWAGGIFPTLALLLMLFPILRLTEVSFMVWPAVLLVDLLAIALAVLAASLAWVLVVLVLTLVATGALIFKIPAELTGLPVPFFLLGAFCVFFVAAGIWMARRFSAGASLKSIHLNKAETPADFAAQVSVFSAALPFLLLIMATIRLPLANPSPVFGLALLLVVLLFGLCRLLEVDGLPAVGLIGVAALETIWHLHHFQTANPVPALVWYLVFYALFTVFPFVFRRRLEERVIPWATAALAGLPQFFLIHRLVKAAWLNDYMGVLPAAFAVPALLGLVMVLKQIPAASKARLSQLAWFGGVALFFITLIFPIQFDRQWITIGWALEGAALLWLFHRVPHPGLRLTGVGLLATAFVRLAFNPRVLEYHPRSATPILNWYLYAYGVVTVCLFLGMKLSAPPRNKIADLNVPAFLATLGTVLAFLLMNIEIADFFSAPGSTLTFDFSGNFGRDMTYSIAWGLFALVLLVIGIARRLRAARYAALGLMCVTLLKLFFHDLAQLNALYRIGALGGVAVIAMLASLAYQRFFAASMKQSAETTPPHETSP